MIDKMPEGEVWRDVEGFEGFYKVSNRGNVFSVERKDSLGRNWGGRTLNPRIPRDGYPGVCLSKNGVRKNKHVHRLVAEAFLPNTNGFPQVNHRDEDKTNNNVENLEWCTSKYNTNHGTRNERISKKVRAVNVETGEVVTFNSIKEAGRKGYTENHICSACRGAYKSPNGNLIGGDGRTYKGHRWSYI